MQSLAVLSFLHGCVDVCQDFLGPLQCPGELLVFLRVGSTVRVAQQGFYEQWVLWEEGKTYKHCTQQEENAKSSHTVLLCIKERHTHI